MVSLFRNRNSQNEPVWHLQLTMLVAIGLQLALPDRFVIGSRHLITAIEALLLVALSFTTPKEKVFKSLSRRINVFSLLGLMGATNIYALVGVVRRLLQTGLAHSGRDLVLVGINIYITNIIIFALWYWEMDAGGPGERAQTDKHAHDFLFPQNQHENYKHPDWQPTFIDYLYVSSTNAMAFSPTDTMPLSRRAKLLMLLQASVSITVIALIAARAVNILG
ncbi:MAG TPA: hypothetical protein VLG37_01955 [Candidatus Saccharimonadales bacterium]|nr:hypothetical protein [Candidatus Saccharimonadales bacterium]